MKESNSNLVNLDQPPFTTTGEKGVSQSKHTQEDEVRPVSCDRLFDGILGKDNTVSNETGTDSVKNLDELRTFGNNDPFTEPDSRDVFEEEVFSNQLTLLDLSSRKLTSIPSNVMSLNNLVYLYLANNKLCQLPDQFLNHFPELQWLDLRYNNLTSLPGRDIDRCCRLHCLLLEGNNIRKLPVELGYVHTLHGLNVRGNPLKMPPEHIIKQGVEEILKYLREKHQEQTQASKQSSEVVEERDLHFYVEDDHWEEEDEEENDEEEDEEEEDEGDAGGKSVNHQIGHKEQYQQHGQDQTQLKQQQQDLLQHHQQQYLLQQQKQQQDLLQQQQQTLPHSDLKEERNADTVQSPALLKSENFSKKQHRDMRKFLEYESQVLARQKNTKIEHILQKRKDEESLKKFRQETKIKQELSVDSDKEIPSITSDAPFGVYEEYMKMMSREEARREPVLTQPLPKLIPLEVKKLISKEKSEKILELEQKIRSHYIKMHERRKKPKGTIAEEVAATKEYMDIARNLQLELEEQRQNLEYRFKAFTADI